MVFDVLAGVFVDDILDVVDVGIFVAPVVVSGDNMLDVNDMLDGVGVGPVVVVDGVVVHVAFVAVVMRPVSILFIDSVDIVGVSSVVMFSWSINKHNTSFILR